MEENHIYQYSLLNALMDGVCETGITVATFAKKGNQGIGTFARMDGELLFLDNTVYQLRAGGDVRAASQDAQIPFAVATNFAPQKTTTVNLPDKSAVAAELDKFNAKAKNLFVTYRVEGRFARVKCRTVQGQEFKGQPLSELGKKQHVAEYEDVEGTIVGFRSPENWQGFAVAGEHLHFIDRERKVGGHVLELSATEVQMQMAIVANVHVELPTSEDFNEAELVSDDAGIKEAEG